MSEYSTSEFLNGLNNSKMLVSAKLIREAILEGKYPGRGVQNLTEASSDIVSIDMVQEPNGEGIAVKQADGHVYKYAADDTHPKYNTPEKLLKAVKKIFKYRKSGPTFGWLRKNAILYAGSKLEAKKNLQTATESLSKTAMAELLDLIRSLHPEYVDLEVTEAAEAFIEDLEIQDDRDYYKIGANKLRKLLA